MYDGGMRIATVLIVTLLAACYSKSDAVRQLSDMGRPVPIRCAILSGGGEGEQASYACTDAAGQSWVCDSDGCVPWGPRAEGGLR